MATDRVQLNVRIPTTTKAKLDRLARRIREREGVRAGSKNLAAERALLRGVEALLRGE